MSSFFGNDLDYQRLMKAGRKLTVSQSAPLVRLALLADCATQQLSILLKALLGEAGLRAGIYEGAFDAIELESCAADSGLYRFSPDMVIVMNTSPALVRSYSRRGEAVMDF